jgi:hypothetical protein
MKEGLICIDLIRIVKDMLYLCIERMFGLTSGCNILEITICRLATMIVARSTKRVGDHLNERED